VKLVRWLLRPDDVDAFLLQPIRGLTRDPEFLTRVTGFYVSRQPAGVVWLTVYTEDAATDAARDFISQRLGGKPDEPGTSADPILDDQVAWYRRALQQVCEAALDLLPARLEDLELLRIVRDPGDKVFFPEHPPSETYRSLLEQRLLERAASYHTLDRSARDELWRCFAEWPSHPYLSPAGHWLWNLVGAE
jgi:hypothetical protein